MTTNAQAALQAAATVHAGSKAYTSAQTVTNLAYQFKHWLDRHDAADEEKAKEDSGMVSASYVAPRVVQPAPRPGPKHFLTEDHNGEPVCHCGWDPARETFPVVRSREQARNDIRLHIVELKNPFLPPTPASGL